ncbi:hypothetical protein U9M48_025601 [Paspalum notatum var. saurae]|uniref:Uncharacterized protein n=1 Tax=Paspalum notatum var. saurae TaxID=547442 RepID=A0AAQ3TQR5_PASNO
MDNGRAGYDDPLGPRDRRRFGVALLAVEWAVVGLLILFTTIVPTNPDDDLAANRVLLVLLFYVSLMSATALVYLSVAARYIPAADRAAERVEGWITGALPL